MLYVILAFLAIVVIISVERFLALRRARTDTYALLNGLIRQLKNNNIKAAIVNCDVKAGAVGEIFRAAIEHWSDGETAIRYAIEETAHLVIRKLETNMKLLNSIVGITPVLGLLGTLFWMIEIFAKMKGTGGQFVGTLPLAGDISGALICTAAGLIVSLVAQLCYTVLMEKIDTIIQEMSKGAIEITYFLTTHTPDPAQEQPLVEEHTETDAAEETPSQDAAVQDDGQAQN